MPDVSDIGSNLIKDFGKGVVDGLVTVPIPCPSHVHYVESDSGDGRVGLFLPGVFREKRVLLASEDVHLVTFGQGMGQALGIHFRAGVVPHRIAVYDLQDLQGNPPYPYYSSLILMGIISPLVCIPIGIWMPAEVSRALSILGCGVRD